MDVQEGVPYPLSIYKMWVKKFICQNEEPPTQTHTHTEDKFYWFFKLKVHDKLSLLVMTLQSIFRSSEQIHAFSTFGLVTIFLSSEILLIYWFEAPPTRTWDNKKLESIDNKSLGPINISDQSRVDVRVCWVFAFSIFSKKNAWAATILQVSKFLLIYPKHDVQCAGGEQLGDIVCLNCFLNIHFADY